MARWRIDLNGKGLRKASVEKLVKKLQDKLEGVSVSVTDNSPPESRADRFDAAKAQIEEAKSEAESLRDELDDWYNNLPENFQDGEKGESLQTAISSLDDFISDCDSATSVDVEFPGMF